MVGYCYEIFSENTFTIRHCITAISSASSTKFHKLKKGENYSRIVITFEVSKGMLR